MSAGVSASFNHSLLGAHQIEILICGVLGIVDWRSFITEVSYSYSVDVFSFTSRKNPAESIILNLSEHNNIQVIAPVTSNTIKITPTVSKFSFLRFFYMDFSIFALYNTSLFLVSSYRSQFSPRNVIFGLREPSLRK